MSSSFGCALKTTIFGQSHAKAIGAVVEGLPAGLIIDEEQLHELLRRRSPASQPFSTPRTEEDHFEIISGLNAAGATCGAPLCFVVYNHHTKSSDYDTIAHIPRPGHADFAARAKWGGEEDYRGGGHFSGRLTCALCLAGGIVLQWLSTQGITITAHVAELGGVTDACLELVDNTLRGQELLKTQLSSLKSTGAPTLDSAAFAAMCQKLQTARNDEDSLGGSIECIITGVPAGVGSPLFDGVENAMAKAFFGIPAVKGVEFGAGFAVAAMRGSENNDPYELQQGNCAPKTNHSGGILGGISNGAPIWCRLAIKPIPSISSPQQSVDLSTMKETDLSITGRHDTTAVFRAVPVVEAAAALAIGDLLLIHGCEQHATMQST